MPRRSSLGPPGEHAPHAAHPPVAAASATAVPASKRFRLFQLLSPALSSQASTDERSVPMQTPASLADESEDIPDDLTTLSNVNDQAILRCLSLRFQHKLIYSFIGSILVALNPFAKLAIYNPRAMATYRQRKLGDLPPHIFAIADSAYTAIFATKKSQCIVVSGESGSGKTETTKLIIQYISSLTNDKSAAAADGADLGIPSFALDTTMPKSIDRYIVCAGPVLEAFGNAKTVRNNNSSRFGKFMEIRFNASGQIEGARMVNYLLERSRIVHPARHERNYHVFYALLAGASDDDRQKWHLEVPQAYHYLSQSDCYFVDGVDDAVEYRRLNEGLLEMGFDTDTIRQLLRVLAGILHLGNVSFAVDKHEAASVRVMDTLCVVADLLAISPSDLANALTQRSSITGAGERFSANCTEQQAVEGRDGLAKTLYGNMFQWILNHMNTLVSPRGAPSSMQSVVSGWSSAVLGMLDIFGFENFAINSFEQFCINFANEELQRYFNAHVFRLEQQLYEEEDIRWSAIMFVDNQACIDLITKRPTGLLPTLNEESNFPKATDQTLLDKFHRAHAPKKNPNKLYLRPVKKQTTTFGVAHYAGEVHYEIVGFLDKNRDVMRHDILSALFRSDLPLLRDMSTMGDGGALQSMKSKSAARNWRKLRNVMRFCFAISYNHRLHEALHNSVGAVRKKSEAAKMRADMRQATSRKPATIARLRDKRQLTVSAQFEVSLGELIATLNTSVPHFVRCIKTNPAGQPLTIDADFVMTQLRYCGVQETTRIRRAGYPTRLSFEAFASRFYVLLRRRGEVRKAPIDQLMQRVPPLLSRLPDASVDTSFPPYQVGKTRIFMRQQLCDFLDTMLQSRLMSAAMIIQRGYRAHLQRQRFLSMRRAAIVFQAYTRGRRARQHAEMLRCELDAAIQLQSWWRMRLAMAQLARLWHEAEMARCKAEEEARLAALEAERLAEEARLQAEREQREAERRAAALHRQQLMEQEALRLAERERELQILQQQREEEVHRQAELELAAAAEREERRMAKERLRRAQKRLEKGDTSTVHHRHTMGDELMRGDDLASSDLHSPRSSNASADGIESGGSDGKLPVVQTMSNSSEVLVYKAPQHLKGWRRFGHRRNRSDPRLLDLDDSSTSKERAPLGDTSEDRSCLSDGDDSKSPSTALKSGTATAAGGGRRNKIMNKVAPPQLRKRMKTILGAMDPRKRDDDGSSDAARAQHANANRLSHIPATLTVLGEALNQDAERHDSLGSLGNMDFCDDSGEAPFSSSVSVASTATVTNEKGTEAAKDADREATADVVDSSEATEDGMAAAAIEESNAYVLEEDEALQVNVTSVTMVSTASPVTSPSLSAARVTCRLIQGTQAEPDMSDSSPMSRVASSNDSINSDLRAAFKVPRMSTVAERTQMLLTGSALSINRDEQELEAASLSTSSATISNTAKATSPARPQSFRTAATGGGGGGGGTSATSLNRLLKGPPRPLSVESVGSARSSPSHSPRTSRKNVPTGRLAPLGGPATKKVGSIAHGFHVDNSSGHVYDVIMVRVAVPCVVCDVPLLQRRHAAQCGVCYHVCHMGCRENMKTCAGTARARKKPNRAPSYLPPAALRKSADSDDDEEEQVEGVVATTATIVSAGKGPSTLDLNNNSGANNRSPTVFPSSSAAAIPSASPSVAAPKNAAIEKAMRMVELRRARSQRLLQRNTVHPSILTLHELVNEPEFDDFALKSLEHVEKFQKAMLKRALEFPTEEDDDENLGASSDEQRAFILSTELVPEAEDVDYLTGVALRRYHNEVVCATTMTVDVCVAMDEMVERMGHITMQVCAEKKVVSDVRLQVVARVKEAFRAILLETRRFRPPSVPMLRAKVPSKKRVPMIPPPPPSGARPAAEALVKFREVVEGDNYTKEGDESTELGEVGEEGEDNDEEDEEVGEVDEEADLEEEEEEGEEEEDARPVLDRRKSLGTVVTSSGLVLERAGENVSKKSKRSTVAGEGAALSTGLGQRLRNKVTKTNGKKKRGTEATSIFSHNGHEFVAAHYGIRTVCEHCDRMVGFLERYVLCRLCKFACHAKCQVLTVHTCRADHGRTREGKDAQQQQQQEGEEAHEQSTNGSELDSIRAMSGGGSGGGGNNKRRLWGMLKGGAKGRYFKVSLRRQSDPNKGVFVSPLLSLAVAAIDKNGLYTAGVYRKPAQHSAIEELKRVLERRGVDAVDFDEVPVPVLCAMLKSWFRELPEPVIAYEQYDDLLRSVTGDLSVEQSYSALYQVCQCLPRENYLTLEVLIYHLVRVAQHGKHNLMDSKALGIVFAPGCLRPPDWYPAERCVRDLPLQILAVTRLIERQQFKVNTILEQINVLRMADALEDANGNATETGGSEKNAEAIQKLMVQLALLEPLRRDATVEMRVRTASLSRGTAGGYSPNTTAKAATSPAAPATAAAAVGRAAAVVRQPSRARRPKQVQQEEVVETASARVSLEEEEIKRRRAAEMEREKRQLLEKREKKRLKELEEEEEQQQKQQREHEEKKAEEDEEEEREAQDMAKETEMEGESVGRKTKGLKKAEKERVAREKKEEKERLVREKKEEKERAAREKKEEKERVEREKQEAREREAAEKQAVEAERERLAEAKRLANEEAAAATRAAEEQAAAEQAEVERKAREATEEAERAAAASAREEERLQRAMNRLRERTEQESATLLTKQEEARRAAETALVKPEPTPEEVVATRRPVAAPRPRPASRPVAPPRPGPRPLATLSVDPTVLRPSSAPSHPLHKTKGVLANFAGTRLTGGLAPPPSSHSTNVLNTTFSNTSMNTTIVELPDNMPVGEAEPAYTSDVSLLVCANKDRPKAPHRRPPPRKHAIRTAPGIVDASTHL